MTTKEFIKHPATITIGVILTLGILAYVGKTYWGWFADTTPNNADKIPDSFTQKQCGGAIIPWTTKYYKENNKYYGIQVCTSSDPNACESLVAPMPNEISEQDYIIAYKNHKTPCDTLIQRMNQGNYQEDISINRTQSKVNYKVQEGIFNANGTPALVGSNLKQKSCGEYCAEEEAIGWSVHQYPKSSIYYPHYECWCHMGATK